MSTAPPIYELRFRLTPLAPPFQWISDLMTAATWVARPPCRLWSKATDATPERQGKPRRRALIPRARWETQRGGRAARPSRWLRCAEFQVSPPEGAHPGGLRVWRPNSCQAFANLFKSISSLCALAAAPTPLRSFRQRRSAGSPSSFDRTRGRRFRSGRGLSRFDPRTDHKCRLRSLQSSQRGPSDRSHRIPARRLGSAPDRRGCKRGCKKGPEERAPQGYC